MNDLWTKINDDIPTYTKDICEKYDLRCVKVSPIKTALIGKQFTLIFALDIFDIGIDYLYKKGDSIVKYSCGNYFAQAFDCKDRENLLSGTGADVIMRNILLIAVHGLCSKWEDVLKGETNWLKKYKNSSRYSIENLTCDEIKMVNEFWK